MSTEKRTVTQEDLDKDASLAEAGVNVGDEHEFEVAADGGDDSSASSEGGEAATEEKKEDAATE